MAGRCLGLRMSHSVVSSLSVEAIIKVYRQTFSNDKLGEIVQILKIHGLEAALA